MQAGSFRHSIRFKLLAGVFAVEVLLAAIFAAVVVVSFRQRLAGEALRSVQKSQGVYDLILKSDTKMLSAALDGFLANDAAARIYAEHADRQHLYSAVRDLYVSNRARYGITHFYFIDKDGPCFLRVHQPQLFGDVIGRETFQRARATGATASGIELGKTAFALRVVTPYARDGKVLGYVEMGEEIDHFDTLVKQETGVDVAVLVEKRFLKEAEYRGVRKAAGQPDDWDDLPDYALVSSTLRDRKAVAESLPPSAARLIDDAEYLGTVSFGQHRLAKGAFPLRDSSRRQVGVVLVLTDVTEQVSAERTALVTLFLVALVVLLLTFGGAAWYLRSQIIGPLVSLSDLANDISMGNVDRKLETTRSDEIGALIHSFERMRLSLKKAFSMLSRKPAPPPPPGAPGIRN